MFAFLSLSRAGIPIWAEFGCGISGWNVAKEFLFGVIVGVGASGVLDDEFTLDLEEDVVGSEWPLRFCGGRSGFGWSGWFGRSWW